MAQKVEIEIVAKDKTGGAVKSVTANFQKLREVGEKITGIGSRLTGAFTAPIIGLGALIAQNEKLQASLKPIQDAFSGIIAQLAEALIPVIKELTPSIIAFANSISGVVKQFAALDTDQKKTILTWVALAAALGPVLMMFGQFLWLIGTAGPMLATFAIGVWAAVGPFVALAAAIYAVIKLVQMNEFKQLAALFYGAVGTAVTGDVTRGRLATQNAYNAMGGPGDTSTGDMVRGLITGPAKTQGGSTVNLTYAPAVSTASSYEAQQVLIPIINQALRQSGGR
jgi:hypothetical protein